MFTIKSRDHSGPFRNFLVPNISEAVLLQSSSLTEGPIMRDGTPIEPDEIALLKSISIDQSRWLAAEQARRSRQELLDNQEVEELCKLHEVDPENVIGSRCERCGSMLLVETGYVPYAPNGALTCADCIEEAGGYCDGMGAIVRS